MPDHENRHGAQRYAQPGPHRRALARQRYAAIGIFTCATLILLILSIRSLVIRRGALKVSNLPP